MKSPKVPATIRNHPAVVYCVPGDEQGSDYRYWVEVAPDWQYTSGRMAGCNSCGFNNVTEFRYANPQKRPTNGS